MRKNKIELYLIHVHVAAGIVSERNLFNIRTNLWSLLDRVRCKH